MGMPHALSESILPFTLQVIAKLETLHATVLDIHDEIYRVDETPETLKMGHSNQPNSCIGIYYGRTKKG